MLSPIRGNLGRFPIAEYLKSIGMEYAWVPSTDDVRPKYGDICRFKTFHMGIALTWDYDDSAPSTWTWYTVESGQGGPVSRCDIIKRKKYPDPHNIPKPNPRYSPDLLQGWIDIDILFAGQAPQEATAGKALSRLWLNEDREVVHPDAPAGGGGPGYFRSAGTWSADHFPSQGLPHPSAPAVRYLDPLAIGELRKGRDVG